MNKLSGKAGEVLDEFLEEISESSKSYSSDGDISSDQDNEQTYSEKMDVNYSNTTDTVISNKGSSTSRNLSINNTKSKAVLLMGILVVTKTMNRHTLRRWMFTC